MSEPAGVPLTIVLFIMVIVNIIGNSLVCLIIKRNRDMRYVKSKIINNCISRSYNIITFLNASSCAYAC